MGRTKYGTNHKDARREANAKLEIAQYDEQQQVKTCKGSGTSRGSKTGKSDFNRGSELLNQIDVKGFHFLERVMTSEVPIKGLGWLQINLL